MTGARYLGTAGRLRRRLLMGGASAAALALGGPAVQAQVVSGSGHTIVNIAGNATTVTTNNVNAASKTGFNRFSQFNVNQPDVVTLVLPSGTQNLVNVVGGDVRIDGAVFSRLASASGDVGGNLFFISSGGFVIGEAGSVNTGRLVVRGKDGNGNLLDTDALYGQATAFSTSGLLDYAPVSFATINGRINARGGIDIKGTNVTVGAGAALSTGAAGVAGVQALVPSAVVSTAGLVEGAALVKVNGGIAIVGADTVVVAGASAGKNAALLDARPSDGPAMPGGIDIASSGQITLAGTLTAWDGTASGLAGDVTVAASKSVTIDNSFENMTLGNYFLTSTAKTGVDVSGTITGGRVSITADASATTASDFNAVKTTVQFLENYGAAKLLGTIGSALDVFYTRSDAQTTIAVGSAASLHAKGDLTVRANSISNAEGAAEAEAEGNNALSLSVAAGVAQVASSAIVTVDGTLRAGGALSVAANNRATSELEVQAVSTEQAKAAAVAYTDVKATAALTIGAAARLDGGTVALSATNLQESGDTFKTVAKTISKDNSAGGGAAAVTAVDIAASLTMAGTIGSIVVPGTVTIDSRTVTNEIINASGASTGSGVITDAKSTLAAFQGDRDGLMQTLLGTAADKFGELVFGSEKDEEEPDPDRKSKRFGAAVSVLFDKQAANSLVSGTITSSGKTEVSSLVQDKTVRNNAKASVAAEQSKDGKATSIAGAAAWSTAAYTSTAIVGGTVTSGGLAVNATTDRPRGGEYDLDFTSEEGGAANDVTAFYESIKDKITPTLGVERGFFASSAGATAKTDSAKNAAISGSVSYTDITAQTRAWINPLTTLNLSGDLAVKADTTITVLNLAGALPVKSAGFATAGGDAAGIAIGYTGINPTTIAGIGKGVVLERRPGSAAVNVDVDAVSAVNVITLAPQGGKSTGKTGSGTFATNAVDGVTRATISKDARLDLGTGKLGLDALTSLELWAVGGSIAITKADGTGDSKTAGSVGVAGALNDVEFDTVAKVGDAGRDDASSASGAAAAANAGITAKDVAITATDTGSINAISVAGTATSTTPAKPGAGSGTETDEKPKGVGSKIKGKLNYAAGLIQAPLFSIVGTYAEYADSYASGVEKAEEAAQQDAVAKGTPVTKGFGIAGSASINLSDLTTRVETTGATFRKAADAAAADSSFKARAVEGVDMLAVTGGAAITTGSAKLPDGNTLISGAYGLSYSTNETASALTATTISGFGNVAVEAAANGSRIGAGMALSADTTKTAKGTTVAASVSHLIARDGAAATVTGGSITGGNAANGAVSILAYNGLTMGAGAGGLSWSSNNAAGGAVTVIDVGSPSGGAANARLVGTPVSGFADLSVRGLTAARIAGIAAAGAINVSGDSTKSALTIGMSINMISMDSTALIDTGATGTGTINVSRAVNVFAGDKAQGETEALASAGKTSGTAGGSLLGNFNLGGSDFSGDDPIRASDLQGGTQILSIAVPISASRGKALGLGFSWNSIDNDRTAAIIGGSASATAPTITAGSLSVQAIDRSDILSLAVGVGGSTEGMGLMGSVSRNLIEGSSSAAVGRSSGAANNLVIDITGAPAATPNVSIGASGDGGIFALAGGIAYGQKSAGGIAVGVNDILRTNAAGSGGVDTAPSAAGLHATIDGVSFKGTPDVNLLANSRGRIIGSAVAIAGSTNGASVAGAATANNLAPTIAANAGRLNYLDASPGDLRIRATDESSILSSALVIGISGAKGALAAGVTVNRIDANVAASLKVAAGDSIRVRNLLVDSSSTAATTSFGLGAGGGSKFGGAGSIAVNISDSDTSSLLTFTGGEITTTGSIGVVAKRDATIDVGAGALAFGAQGAAIGASVIVNQLGGTTEAKIAGSASNAGTINAFTGSGDETARSLAGLRTGGLTSALPQFDALNSFGNLALNGVVKSETAAFKGVAVNASSTAATRTIAITGAISGSGAAVGVTGVVSNITGSTTASMTDTNVTVGSASTSQAGVALDVRASSQQVGMTFAGAVAGSGGGVAAAAPVISDGYAGTTSALLKGGALASSGTIGVKAVGNQSSTTLAAAGAVASSVGAAVAGVSPRFQATTSAVLSTPSAVRALGGEGVAITADSSARALATFGSLAIGGNGAGAGAVVVATNENRTKATYEGTAGGDGLGNVTVDAAKVAVAANGKFDAMVAGASVAGSAGISLVGNGVGVVHRGEVTASADALTYNRPSGSVSVKAAEAVSIVPVVGQVAIGASPTGAGASLGVIAVLAQSKVDATLSRPTVNAGTVAVQAAGFNQIDAVQLGLAVGGVGIGANVTYLGIGKVTDTGALTASSGGSSSDSKVAESTGSTGSGNKNMTQLAAGGSMTGSQIAAQTGSATSASERSSAAGDTGARSAFTGVSAPGDASEARVRAQVTGGSGSGLATVAAGTLSIDSEANLRSKSTNVQGTAGIGAGSATVAITRNAAQSISFLGDVAASGGTFALTATTGEKQATGAPSTINNPTKAAEAEIYSGTVGIGALAVGVADVKLQSAAVASAAGRLAFTNATIKAEDLTNARAYAVGAVAGGGAINVTIAQAVKDGTVSAQMANRSTSAALNVVANALGGAKAEAYAGAGGLIFAGNAAVAEATDRRTVRAVVAEGTTITGTSLLVNAKSTPLVTANSFGVAISGGVAAGASVANATASGTVSALIGEGSVLSCPDAASCLIGGVTVQASVEKPESGDNVRSSAKGSAGGYLAAANGASAISKADIATTAGLGVDLNGAAGSALTLPATVLEVRASRALSQYSESTGVTAAGILALGAQRAESTSSGTTRAALENVDGSARGIAGAYVGSKVLDENKAKVQAGAGGLGAGLAAMAYTNSNGSAVTDLTPANGKTFRAGLLTVEARSAADYHAQSDSMLASAVGASGTTSDNRVNTSATVNVGRNIAGAAAGGGSRFEAAEFRISATNVVGEKTNEGGGAAGAGGGIATGAAALVNNVLNQAATVNLRDGLTLRQYGGDATQNSRATYIDAAVKTSRKQGVTLEVGGAMQLPFAEANSTYNANTNVNVGNNILIRADQGIGIGTNVQQATEDTAGVQVYGLAGLGGGKTNATSNVKGLISVGDGTMIESMMDIRLSAGTRSDGVLSDNYGVVTQTDTFNWTALPLDTEAKAKSTVNADNRLVLGASTIRSARDLILQGQAGTASPSASGTGHNPYLELFSITNGSGDTATATTGSIKLDGTTLTAGFLNNRTVTVESNGNAPSTRDGVAIAGSTGFKVTTNDVGDPDRLGQFTVSGGSFNTLDYVSQQIVDVKAQITARGLAIPVDPATASEGTPERQALRDALNLAASQSELLATLAGLYETRLALAGTTTRPAVVVGGAIASSVDPQGVTRYGIAANGGIFAAGGRVTFTSDRIDGGRQSNVTANAGGVLTVDNKTGFDTIVGNVFVPFKVNGAISYAGKAQALPGTATANLPTGNTDGAVTVTSGTASTRSDVIVLGTVQNISGAFKAVTPSGNYVQFGAVNVASFAAEAPSGLFTVSAPGGTFSQGLPLSFFYGAYGMSMFDVSGRNASMNAIQASEYLASYVAGQRLGRDGLTGGLNALVNAFPGTFPGESTTAGGFMYDMFLKTSRDNAHYGSNFIARTSPYGGPGRIVGNGGAANQWGGGYVGWLPCTQTCEFASEDSQIGANTWGTHSLFVWDGESGSVYRNDVIYQVVPTYRDGVLVANPTNAQLPATYPAQATDYKPAISAQQVLITAKYIDISGTITAGPIKQRSLTINNVVDDLSRRNPGNIFDPSDDTYETISFGLAMARLGTSIDLLKGASGFAGLTGAGNNIGAQFIATGGLNPDGTAKGYIKVDDVAAAGGGSITLNGKIVNTNPLGGGKLKVLNGFGNIAIENKTGYEIEVGTINAGLSAEGRITLRDGNTVTEYTNSVGGQVVQSVIQNGTVQAPIYHGGNAGLSDSSPLWYNPTGRIYYTWTDERSIKRVMGTEGSVWLRTVTPWAWDESQNNQAPQGGRFIDLDADWWDNSAGTISRALAGGNAEFVQVFKGNVTSNSGSTIRPGQDGRLGVNFDIPLAANLSITSAAKATYPIAIVFDQGTNGGGINVVSNNGGQIKLTGTLTFGGGTVALAAEKSGIVSSGDGLVVSQNLSISARNSIGVIGNTAQGIVDAPFRANLMGGAVYATSSSGDINLALNSVSSVNGAAAPTYVGAAFASNGSVKIDSNTSLVGRPLVAGQLTFPSIIAGGDVTLSARGSITGAVYQGASNLASQGLTVDIRDSGVLTATAGGDIAIEQVSIAGDMGANRRLQIGEIVTNGNVLLKAPGSIVAADATATVDQEKLARFLAAAKALQLAPECASNCGTQDAATAGTLDQAIRADGRAAYAKLQSTVPGEAAAAEALLTSLFGSVPASEASIATLSIKREAKIGYQLRNQGRDAYDRYALFDPAATAESSRGLAVSKAIETIGKVASFGGKEGIALSVDSRTVTITDASAASLAPGGELYQIALSSLASNGQAPGAPSADDLQRGLQLYLDGLRAPMATLLPGALPDLAGLDPAAQAAAVSDRIGGGALTEWVTAQSLVAQRNRATTDALGRVQDIHAFGANAGLSLSADASKVTVSDWSNPSLQPGGALYQLGLATLRSKVNDNGLRDTIPLPTNADVERGLQAYLDGLRSPILDLLPGALPTLAGSDLAVHRAAVSSAISDASLASWASKQQSAAVAELTGLFGAVPISRDAIATASLLNMGARTNGAVWSQSMLDVAFPSTAFVPVADTQFETRKPVIRAQGVTLVAGNSIGAFDAQRTFTYDATGFQGPAAEKDLATAYLASAGPGDLVVNPIRSGGKVVSVSFTTRRDQPLQLNANGIVNAIAGTDYATLAPKMDSSASTVLGNIFLNNSDTLTIGTIVSEKWRVGTSSAGCALGSAPPANCESRIRLVAPDIVGATSGAAALQYTLNGTTRRLDSGDGRALIMGGLVRMEASNGSIVSADYGTANARNRGAILVDTAALEVLRAAGDIALVRRSNVPILHQAGSGFGSYAVGNDLIVGDVFAGGRLQLDNPSGSMFVGRIESPLESERRNSRIVASVLSLRAAGDIGSADVGSTGIVGQFDIQAPIIDQFIAGYDYATGLPGVGPAPAGLGTGSGFFALRGVSQIGGFATSMLGARGDITIGTLNNNIGVAQPIKSSVTFLSDVLVGGMLNLTTDGDVAFPDPEVRITGIGLVQDPNVVDLSRLALNLKGRFDYFNTRSIILGSLTAGGGVIESSLGSVTVNGTLYGNGGPETPFTLMGRTGVTIGSTGLGAVALLSSHGDVRVTGQTRASDLTVEGRNIFITGGLYGRSASITAAPDGLISIGGSVLLQRDSLRPNVASTFRMSGGDLTLNDIISAQDSVTINGRSITGTSRALFVNTGTLTLAATQALRLDPATRLANIGSAHLSSGSAAAGGSTVTLSSFNGGALTIDAPVGIAIGATTVSGALSLSTAGTLALNGSVTAGQAVNATARTISFSPSASIRDAGSISLVASEAINASAATNLTSRGLLTISARDSLTLGSVTASGGSIDLSAGSATLNRLTTAGGDFRVQTGGSATFTGALALGGNFEVSAGGNYVQNGVMTLSGGNGAATADIKAAGAMILGRNARISATAPTAHVRIGAGSVAIDPLASIAGAALTLNARDSVTLGNIQAGPQQMVSIRSSLSSVEVGAITGGTTTIAANGGSVTARGALNVGALTVTARDNVLVNRIAATQATIIASTGTATLNSTVRVRRPDSPSSARLTVTAGKAITIGDGTGATGGMTFTSPSVRTVGAGYLSDQDLQGALTTLRADFIDVTFNTGTQSGRTPIRIDARGRTSTNVNDATFRFDTLRPIQFDALFVNRGLLSASTVISLPRFTMRDYLLFSTPNGSVALEGQAAAPAATRTVATGPLSGAVAVVTPGAGAPGLMLNGIEN